MGVEILVNTDYYHLVDLYKCFSEGELEEMDITELDAWFKKVLIPSLFPDNDSKVSLFYMDALGLFPRHKAT